MGYFTETMALFEFKGDAEMAYANRRRCERQTGSHTAGKAVSRLAKHSVNNNGHEGADSYYRGIKDITSDKSLGDSKKERLDNYSSRNKSAASEFHDNADKLRNKYKGKPRNESFSEAFDSIIL